MMTNKKTKNVLSEYKKVIFDEPGILIYEEWCGNYGFEIQNKVYTSDIVEAVSYFMNFTNFDNKTFWKLPISNINIMHINPINALYWLSGGDDFWKNNDKNLKWSECYEIILENFSKIIFSASFGKTLNDIRENIKNNLNLDDFYDFILQKCLI